MVRSDSSSGPLLLSDLGDAVADFDPRQRPQAEDSAGKVRQYGLRCAQNIVKVVNLTKPIALGDIGSDADGQFQQPRMLRIGLRDVVELEGMGLVLLGHLLRKDADVGQKSPQAAFALPHRLA